jgi:hypothetical protein
MVTRNRFPRPDQERRARPAPPNGATNSKPAESWAALRTAFGAFGRRLPEIRDDLSCYASVQADRARLAMSQAGSRVAASILQLVVVGAVCATAATLVIVGIAGGVAILLQGNVWLANTATGAATLLVLTAAFAGRNRLRSRQRMQRLQRRYEAHGPVKRDTTADRVAAGGRSHAERS